MNELNDSLTSTTVAGDEPELDLVFAVRPPSQAADEVEVVFADGLKILPGWLVANLGGKELLSSPGAQAQLRQITYEAFMAHWAEQNTRATIGRTILGVRNQHLAALKKGRV